MSGSMTTILMYTTRKGGDFEWAMVEANKRQSERRRHEQVQTGLQFRFWRHVS